MDQTISVVIPTLNEEDHIEEQLEYHLNHFNLDEVIVADGGSDDQTVGLARDVDDRIRVISTKQAGRGHQLRRGCLEATGDWIMMLHADSRLPAEFDVQTLANSGAQWGWFDCRVNGDGPLYWCLSRAISLRSAMFQSPTGDQAIWVRRDLLESVGGVPEVPIMEDVVLVNTLRGVDRGHRIRSPVTTSARKWEREGILTVILLMWWFRLAFWFGASPSWIYRQYYGSAPETDTG